MTPKQSNLVYFISIRAMKIHCKNLDSFSKVANNIILHIFINKLTSNTSWSCAGVNLQAEAEARLNSRSIVFVLKDLIYFVEKGIKSLSETIEK